jgi:hypothetical protein
MSLVRRFDRSIGGHFASQALICASGSPGWDRSLACQQQPGLACGLPQLFHHQLVF